MISFFFVRDLIKLGWYYCLYFLQVQDIFKDKQGEILRKIIVYYNGGYFIKIQ